MDLEPGKGGQSMKRTILLCVAVACLPLTACVKSNEPAAPKGQQAAVADGQQAAVPGGQQPAAAHGQTDQQPAFKSSTPTEAATEFLNALRDGNEKKINDLLTMKAREESAKNGLAFNPDGKDSAEFNLGEVEYVFEDQSGARVHGSWTETTYDGTHTLRIACILRKEPAGWRIAGLAAEAQGQEDVINFEDPDEMRQRRQEVEERERLAREMDAELREARARQNPANETLPR